MGVEQGPDQRRTLKLAGDINVSLAAELHRHCVELSKGASRVVVECDQVTSLDLAALQIIVALSDALVAQGGTMGISGLSQEVTGIVQLAGFGDRLGLDGGSLTKGDAK
jgi:anti-anti-sigma factor